MQDPYEKEKLLELKKKRIEYLEKHHILVDYSDMIDDLEVAI